MPKLRPKKQLQVADYKCVNNKTTTGVEICGIIGKNISHIPGFPVLDEGEPLAHFDPIRVHI